MATPPKFNSIRDYVASITDVGFWWPYVSEIVERHDLPHVGREPVAGYNATYPTFLYGDVVVKLFGYWGTWRERYASERAAHILVGTDPKIAAPRLLAEGSLFGDADAPWPYFITERMSGAPWWLADLSTPQKISVIGELGRQIHRVHQLSTVEHTMHSDWQVRDIVAAAKESSLPHHMVAQIDEYLARLNPFDYAFVHGDLVDNHIYVMNGRLSGIIDWGDAMIIDRHYDLAKLYFGAFNCNKDLLRVFLDASEWPVNEDFAHKALGLALHRQALGFAQHHTFDVFHNLPNLIRLDNINSLDELAVELFAL